MDSDGVLAAIGAESLLDDAASGLEVEAAALGGHSFETEIDLVIHVDVLLWIVRNRWRINFFDDFLRRLLLQNLGCGLDVLADL